MTPQMMEAVPKTSVLGHYKADSVDCIYQRHRTYDEAVALVRIAKVGNIGEHPCLHAELDGTGDLQGTHQHSSYLHHDDLVLTTEATI